MNRLFSLLISLMACLGPAAAVADLLPSEATTIMLRKMQQEPGTARTLITRPIMTRLRADKLDEAERFLKGEAHFINLEPEPARDAFWEFRNHDNDYGRVAWQKLMIIRINAFGMTEQVLDRDIPMYRERFGIRSDDRYGIGYPLMQAAKLLAEAGEADRALDMVAEEVRLHDKFDAPYFSYSLPNRFMEMAAEQGRRAEFQALRQWVIAGLDDAIRKRLALTPPLEQKKYSLPGGTLATLFDDQLKNYYEWTAEFRALRAGITSD